MSTDHDRLLSWLSARDPGDAPARLRAAAARVPYEIRQPALPRLDAALTRVFGVPGLARPLVVILVVLAIVLSAVGAAVFQPWRPFPPRGLIAFISLLGPAGTSGIRLVAADGAGERLVTPLVPNVYDHSARWSADGRILLFARNSKLDPMASCGGVGSIVLYDVATATERVVATDLRPIDTVSWSPSGDRIAYLYPPTGCGAQGELGVVDVATGAVTTTRLGDGTGGTWQVRWSGDVPSAVVASHLIQNGGGDFTITREAPSHDGAFVATFAFTSLSATADLQVSTGSGNRPVDLGSGASPAWAPDDSALAFIRPNGPGDPDHADLVRDELAIASGDGWRSRIIAQVLWPSNAAPYDLPRLFWTSDGGAVYWVDGRGGHVVDVVTGRQADLPASVASCPDLQWQPLP